MRKIKLALIANASSRRAVFMKRSKGLKKKLNELTTLSDVKACAVINNPYQSAPDLWPSPEGVQEVVSMFRELPEAEQTRYMMNPETLLQDKIAKKENKLKKITQEKRELYLKEFMFDCLQGKMSQYHYDARDYHDLILYIDNYVDQLRHHKTQLLITTGESSSFSHVPVASNDPFVTVNPQHYVDAARVTAPVGSFDHIQYQNMNQNQQEPVQHKVVAGFDHLNQYQNMAMNQNQQELVQQHNVSADFDHLNQYQNMDMNQNQMEEVPYQTPDQFYNQTQHAMYQDQQEPVQHNVSADFDYFNQYQNMDMNQNQMEEVPYQNSDQFYDQTQNAMYQDQQEPLQHNVSANFDYLNQYQHMDMNQNQMEGVSYPNSDQFYDQTQHGVYQNMDLGTTQNVNVNMNHYPGQEESFMDQMVEQPQQMSYVGEHANSSYMVDNHYNNYQLPRTDDQIQHEIYQNMDLGFGQGESLTDQIVEDPQQMSYVGENAST